MLLRKVLWSASCWTSRSEVGLSRWGSALTPQAQHLLWRVPRPTALGPPQGSAVPLGACLCVGPGPAVQ